MMKKLSGVFLTVLLLCLVAGSAYAQGDELSIGLRRDFGYSSGGADIQGLFTITITSVVPITRVTIYLDDQPLGEGSASPFKLQFNTDKYPLGAHTLYASAATADGREIKTRVLKPNFVSASDSWKAAVRILVPILSITLIAVLSAALFPILTGRRTVPFPSTPQNYPLGGAVCPKCEHPFPIHIYGLNMLTHKYDRCPYCGKWSMVRFAPMDRLRQAEQAVWDRANEKGTVQGVSEADRLKKELDDSRFND